jgi:chromosome-anchoring protein RacA
VIPLQVYRTKDVARELNVSATTVKRWACHFRNRFRKDEAGRYVFSEEDLDKLRLVKQRLDEGAQLNSIELGGTTDETEAAAEVAAASTVSETAAPALDKRLWERLDMLELQLDQKANEVTEFKVLQHRKELDELRSQIADICQTLERMEVRLTELEHAGMRQDALGSSKPARKRRFLGML